MAITRKVFGQLAEIVLEGGAKKATKFFSPTEVVKATFQGKRNKRARSVTVLFTVGAPNFKERLFISKAKEAGETFPVKKIQIRRPAVDGDGK